MRLNPLIESNPSKLSKSNLPQLSDARLMLLLCARHRQGRRTTLVTTRHHQGRRSKSLIGPTVTSRSTGSSLNPPWEPGGYIVTPWNERWREGEESGMRDGGARLGEGSDIAVGIFFFFFLACRERGDHFSFIYLSRGHH